MSLCEMTSVGKNIIPNQQSDSDRKQTKAVTVTWWDGFVEYDFKRRVWVMNGESGKQKITDWHLHDLKEVTMRLLK